MPENRDSVVSGCSRKSGSIGKIAEVRRIFGMDSEDDYIQMRDAALADIDQIRKYGGKVTTEGAQE